MTAGSPDTAELLTRASRGDGLAVEQLMKRHRRRLRQMVAIRMHPSLAARVDPSDVVQEALADASQRLPDYLRDRPLRSTPGCAVLPGSGWWISTGSTSARVSGV
jgi:RNA polymerase sigma-70 factor, ECF subfamily